MANRPHRSMFIVMGLSVVGTLAMLVLLNAINDGVGFAGCTASAAFGWLLPLLSGALVAVIAWMLIDGDRGDPHVSAADSPESTTCMHCGTSIMQEWKLCPYCGQLRECDMRIDPHSGRRSNNDATEIA
ncbi:MAG: hypothetical protein PF636_12140 [Actinomycetota bacterium]|jgi:hypothetical protein|nr:hypothetical protein [Actinomycetota bacterium]